VKHNTYTKGWAQYSENMVTITSSTIFALVRSVAVHSMNTFLVFNVILLCSPVKKGTNMYQSNKSYQ